MNTAKQNFKGCIRTVKKALNGDICPQVFNDACNNNPMLQKALICYKNKNTEQKELNFKWYRK